MSDLFAAAVDEAPPVDLSSVRLSDAWKEPLRQALSSPQMASLRAFLVAERQAGKKVFPPSASIFSALDLVEPKDVRVVILGQDPYHGDGQAHGLSFSVMPGVRPPPSLQNVYRELQKDLGHAPVRHGFLEAWARQGVLLLNDSLTVERGQAGSHRGKGWEPFTDAVVRIVAEGPPTAFMLWGRNAKEKAASVDASRHLVIATSHPSPMGDACNKGFFGSRPFSRTNAFLKENGRGEIDWKLPESVS
jgi:uracil-DNA glycosylase